MSNNPNLGQIECEACGGEANIRRQSNGRRLLYLHCANCGMDKRSGANLQAKWQKAIGEISPQAIEKPEESGEWVPESTTRQVEENEVTKNENSKSGGIGKLIIGTFLAVGAIIGVNRS